MRASLGGDLLAFACVTAYYPDPILVTVLVLMVFVGGPLYAAHTLWQLWLAHRRGIARVRAYDARIGR